MFPYCRKGWNSISSITHLRASSWMIMSVLAAHIGCDNEKFRFFFNQMMSIASFLTDMSRRSSPPSFIGWHNMLQAILGDESSSHMKPFIILFRAVSMCQGIPCVLARNCMWPPTTAWIISFLPFRVGCSLFHLSRLLFILSIIVSQGVLSFVWLPIHAPSILINSPSLVMCIFSVSGLWSCSFSFLVDTTLRLCSVMPMGMTSVFSMLNFAPDISHQLLSTFWTWS